MAMGAFVAGVLLSESTFRHQLETDIEPFRGILLGLFFMGVGMNLDLGVLRSDGLLILAGVVLLARPMQGVLTLTIVTGAYFVAEGIATIMYALEHRRELSGRWSWLLIAGLMDILVAFFIIAGLPESAGWAIGLLVGLNLMFGGATLIGMALAARNT